MRALPGLSAAAFLLTATALPVAAQSPEAVAEAALDAAPVWDGHNDVPQQLRDRYRNMLVDFDFADTRQAPSNGWSEGGMHTDIVRLRAGRVGAQFWSVYVSASLDDAEATVAVLEQIDVMKRVIDRYPDVFTLALTSDDVEQAMEHGRIASLLGMEGGYAISNSLAVLRQFHALGVRYMTLSHSKAMDWADSATDVPQHDGLTGFGEQVVREMNRLGMLVDLSHVSEATMLDALDVGGAPVIFSHSGARAVNGHARNVPDSVLARLPANGGIVMVVALPQYIDEDLRQRAAERAGETARLKSLLPGQPDAVAAALAEWDSAHPAGQASIADMADHIDHIRDVAGIEHIGIGGDYDGMLIGPVGMEDVSGYLELFVELARRGYSQQDLEKIASRNMMRVLREAEAFAASQSGMRPIETPVD